MQRADLNTALIRFDSQIGPRKKPMRLKDIQMRYGRKPRSRRMTTDQMRELGKAMAVNSETEKKA